MLIQKDEEGKRYLVYAISRSLSQAEENYHSTKLEQLAVVYALGRLRHYLYGQKFTVVTDCTAVSALKATGGDPSPQMKRWMDFVAEFDYEVVHRPGTSMQHVDALSRGPVEQPCQLEEEPLDVPVELLEKRVLMIRTGDRDILTMQATDPWIRERIEVLKKSKKDRSAKEHSKVQGFKLQDGILFKVKASKEKPPAKKAKITEEVATADGESTEDGRASARAVEPMQFVVPALSRKYILVIAHDKAGHFGVDKTLEMMGRHYWFPKMKEYTAFHIRACLDCLYKKQQSGRKEGFLNPIPPERRPFQKVFVDHVGPMIPSHGMVHVIVLVDGLSKFVVLEAVKNTSAQGVVKFLERVFTQYGAPDFLVSDRGTAFTANATRDFLESKAVTHLLISSQKPSSNGQCERINKEVGRLLRSLSEKEDGSDWAKHVASAQAMLNRVVSRSTGRSPFEVLHGYFPRMNNQAKDIEEVQGRIWTPASEVQEAIREHLQESQRQYAYYYDKKKRPHYVRLQVGDVVAVSRLPIHTGKPTKLQPKFRGPMIITEVLPHDTYRLVQLGKENYTCTAHCSQIRWYKLHQESMDDATAYEPEDSDNEEPIAGGAQSYDSFEAANAVDSPAAVRQSTMMEVAKEQTEETTPQSFQEWREPQAAVVISSSSESEKTTVESTSREDSTKSKRSQAAETAEIEQAPTTEDSSSSGESRTSNVKTGAGVGTNATRASSVREGGVQSYRPRSSRAARFTGKYTK